MKKIALLLGALLGSSVASNAGVNYSQSMYNSTACATQNIDLNLNTAGANNSSIDKLSLQLNVSSAQPSAMTFTDGVTSTASIKIANNSYIAPAFATNTVTVASDASLAAVAATNYITIASTQGITNATIFFNGIPFVNGGVWKSSNSLAATNISLCTALATELNIVTATGPANVCYTTAAVAGSAGNLFTLTSSTAAITVSSAKFTGGKDHPLTNAYLTVNGVALYPRSGETWTGKSTDTAVFVARLLSSVNGIKASTANGVGLIVTATATTAGTAANSFTLVSSTTGWLTAGGANFSGGIDAAQVTINGKTITLSTAATAASAANKLSDAIMADSYLKTIVKSTWSAAGIVTSTSITGGSQINYPLTTNDTNCLTLSATCYWGGYPSDINISTYTTNPYTVNKSSAGGYNYGLAQPLLFKKTAGTAPSPLVDKTTYYAVNILPQSLQLSDTSTGALAGIVIKLSSFTAAGGGSFVLTPSTMVGTSSWKFQASDDGNLFFDIYLSSVSDRITISAANAVALAGTFATPYTTVQYLWDLKEMAFKYLRLAFTAGTWSQVSMNAIINGKQ